MVRAGRRLVYCCVGLWVFVTIFGDDTDPPDKAAAVFDTQVVSTTPLPNDPQKADTFAAIPQTVSLPAPPQVTPTPAPAPAPDYVFVTGSRVNLRAGPSTDFARVGAFDRGTKLVLLGDRAGWAKVTGAINGTPTTGWMSQRYLSLQPPAIPAARPAPTPKRTIAAPTSAEVSAAQRAIIQQSIANYAGSCPCDYNRDRAGRRCGKRSAWSRPGGASPLCYASDVKRSHLVAYFRRLGRQYP